MMKQLALVWFLALAAIGVSAQSTTGAVITGMKAGLLNPVVVTTTSLPGGSTGTAYGPVTLAATGGIAPYSWSFTGSLAPGLSLNLTTGVINGTPTAVGTFTIHVKATDSSSPPFISPVVDLSIGIATVTGADNRYCLSNEQTIWFNAGSGTSSFDSFAEQPRTCVRTSLADTPSSSGSTKWVCPSGQTVPASCIGATMHNMVDLATAIGNGTVACGDVVKIASTSDGTPTGTQNVYIDFGGLTVPGDSCDATHWITVETDQVGSLPAEGTRITPAWAGQTSWVGRPPFAQPTTAGVYMPKIMRAACKGQSLAQGSINFTPDDTGSSPFSKFIRFIGLEVTQMDSNNTYAACTAAGGAAINIAAPQIDVSNHPGTINTVSHIVFDRMLVHCDNPQGISRTGCRNGINASGAYIAIVDSWIGDEHCGWGGSLPGCTESHAIAFGTQDGVQGPVKIVNNFLESSGVIIFTGGATTSYTPTDIEIRRNFAYRPWTIWMKNQPGWLGVNFGVKNDIEFKLAKRALIEGNVLKYVWHGQGDQVGAMVNIQSLPQNQNTYPFQVETSDVIYRYNFFQHSMNVISISSEVTGGTPAPLEIQVHGLDHNISVHDNVWDDVNANWFSNGVGGNCCGGAHFLKIVNSSTVVPPNQLHHISLRHNTVIQDSYSRDATIATITTSSGVSTVTATGPLPNATAFVTGKVIHLWGSSTNCYNGQWTITSVIGNAPATFTFSAPAGCTASASDGFLSQWNENGTGSIQLNENANDNAIAAITGDGVLTKVRTATFPSAIVLCFGNANPVGCTHATPMSIYGYTGPLAGFNGTSLSPIAQINCTAAAAPDPFCTKAADTIIEFNSAMNASDSIATKVYISYWNNTTGIPNTIWPNFVQSDNIMGYGATLGGGICLSGNCNQSLPSINSVLSQTGAAAWCIDHNVAVQGTILGAASNPLPSSNPVGNACPTSVSGGGNSDSTDSTYNTVGFPAAFLWDNMGQGVTDVTQLKLCAAISGTCPAVSPFHNTASDGKDPGADIDLVNQFTAGVQ